MSNIFDVISRLKSSLDSNHNIVDMKTFMEVFSELEQTCFTKRVLEDSKLVAYILDICENTKDKILYFCARNLIQTLRFKIGITSSNGCPLSAEYAVLNNLPTIFNTLDEPSSSSEIYWENHAHSQMHKMQNDFEKLSTLANYVANHDDDISLSDAIAELKAKE